MQAHFLQGVTLSGALDEHHEPLFRAVTRGNLLRYVEKGTTREEGLVGHLPADEPLEALLKRGRNMGAESHLAIGVVGGLHCFAILVEHGVVGEAHGYCPRVIP